MVECVDEQLKGQLRAREAELLQMHAMCDSKPADEQTPWETNGHTMMSLTEDVTNRLKRREQRVSDTEEKIKERKHAMKQMNQKFQASIFWSHS
jgi:hypothetical protein